MRLTITNDEGDIYTYMTNVRRGGGDQWIGNDDEGDEATVESVLDDAAKWDRKQRVRVNVREGIAILRAGGDLDEASNAMLGRNR